MESGKFSQTGGNASLPLGGMDAPSEMHAIAVVNIISMSKDLLNSY